MVSVDAQTGTIEYKATRYQPGATIEVSTTVTLVETSLTLGLDVSNQGGILRISLDHDVYPKYSETPPSSIHLEYFTLKLGPIRLIR